MKIILSALLIVASFAGKSQNFIRTIGLSGFDNPSEYNFLAGAEYDLFVTVKYEAGDDPVFIDDITIMYITDKMIDDGTGSLELIPEIPVNIPLGETDDLFRPNFEINPNNFRVGGNIVVIWPSYSVPPLDSLLYELEVSDTLGTGIRHDLETQARIQFASKKLIAGTFYSLGIKSMTLYGIDGQKLCALKPNTEFDLSSLPKGYYLLSFIDPEGKWYVVKVPNP